MLALDAPAFRLKSSGIPLADVLRAANDLVAAGLIQDYALGGALAAIYYTEPFTTYDADIIFITTDKSLSAGIPAIYSHRLIRHNILYATRNRLPTCLRSTMELRGA